MNIITLLRDQNIDEACHLMTPEIAKRGELCNISIQNIVWMFTQMRVRGILIFEDHCNELGYISPGYHFEYASYDWENFEKIYAITGACKNKNCFFGLVRWLEQWQIDWFFNHGLIIPSLYDFYGFYSSMDEARDLYTKTFSVYLSREYARRASCVLISIGKQNGSLDTMRIIARVVWSERMIHKWCN